MPPRPPELGPGPGIGAAAALFRTAQLGPADLEAVRRLLDVAFEGDLSDADWSHALGGVHALVHAGGDPVAHGAVVQRRFLHGGRTLRVGYVEAVAVHPAFRGRGHASAVMAALEDVVRASSDAGALGATEAGAPLYRHRGWQAWRGTTWALTPTGRMRTPEDDDAVFVLPVGPPLDLDGELTCDWRDGDLW